MTNGESQMRSYHITIVSLSVLLVLAAGAAATAGAVPYPINRVESGLVVSDSLTTGNTANWIQGGTAQSYDFYEDSQGLHIGVQSPQSGQWVNHYTYSSQPEAYLFHAVVSIPDTVVPDGVSNIGLYVEGSDFIPHVGCEAYADWSGYYWVVEQSADAGETYNILYISSPNSLPQTQDCTIVTNGSNYLRVYIGGNVVFSSTTMNLGMSAPFIAYFQGDTSSSSSMHYATYRNYYTTSDESITITNNPTNAATAKIVSPSGQTLASSSVASGTATLNVGKYNFPLPATINVYDSNNSIIASSPATIYGGDVYSTDVPPSTVPQPPTGLASSAVSSSRINLSWNAPSNDGGSPVTGYKIERSASGGAFSVLVANTGSAGTAHSDTGLSAGTTYTYRVSAINAVGSSSPSNTASAATLSVPSKPTSLAATAFSFSQIDLSWVAPSSSGGSAITGYNIERSGDGGSTWGTVASNTGTTATEYSDTGLAPSTTYTYRVSAINAVGTGLPSDSAFATTSQQPPLPITLTSSGLISYDPLNNETKTRQELEASQGFWHYDGSAFSLFDPPAPTDLFKDSQGLHLAVKTPANGTYAGYYAVTPVPATASLFHAKITTPVRTISGDYFQNGLYVQTADGRINYVTCVSITGTAGTSWHVVRTYGTFIEATSFEVLYSEYGANLPLSRDCTIITNGNNYLKVYLDGVNVYTNSTLDLQMPAPYLYFLEPQNDHTQMLYGIYEDYYSTKGETIQVNAIPVGASRVDLTGSTGNVLSTAPATGGTAALDIGKYHYPLVANIKVYDSNNVVMASTTGTAGMFGGDVFTVSADSPPPDPTAPAAPSGLSASAASPSQINLAWNAPNSGGSPITGYKIERSLDDGGTWSVLASNTGNAGTAYSDTGLNPSTAYGYRVSAINAVGAGAPSNTAFATTGAALQSGIVINDIRTTSGTTSAPNQITLSNFNAGAGNDRLLVVGVQANNNDAASVTFGGVPLTKKASSFYNDDAEFWYAPNPGGTADIVVTMNGPTSAVVGAYSISGVDQANPIPTYATSHNANPNSPTVSITTAYPNSLVLDLPSVYGGVTLSSPTCAQSWDLNIPDKITGASSSSVQATAGAVTCQWTASGNDLWDDVAIEIKASE